MAGWLKSQSTPAAATERVHDDVHRRAVERVQVVALMPLRGHHELFVKQPGTCSVKPDYGQ